MNLVRSALHDQVDVTLVYETKLYSFKMVDSKSLVKKLTKFNKIIDFLHNIEVNLTVRIKLHSL
jgi:hypothetical protein